MNIDVSVTLSFSNKDGKMENGIKIDLAIPTGDMSPKNPVKFLAMQVSDTSEQELSDKEKTVLEVAVGDKEHVYVAVAPPRFLLEKAGIQETVRALDVKVQEGKYEDGKFVVS